MIKYRKELEQFLSKSKIDGHVRDMKNEKREGRKRWNDPYIRDRHIERVLYNMLTMYKSMNKI